MDWKIHPTITWNSWSLLPVPARFKLFPTPLWQCIRVILHPHNSFTCLKIDKSSAMIVYMYYLNKLTDLIETVFFVMKKSWRQVTFLHVYHHASVIACNYIDIYLQPGKRASNYGLSKEQTADSAQHHTTTKLPLTHFTRVQNLFRSFSCNINDGDV